MKPSWQIHDLIDLEYFLGRKFRGTADEAVPDGPDFDREAYLSFPGEDKSDTGRRALLRHWLEKRRELEKKSGTTAPLLPGETFAEAMGIVRLLISVIALVFGAGLAWGLLSYSGREPVNVFTCLWILVVPQVLLLLALAVSAAVHKIHPAHSFKLLYPILSTFIRTLIDKLGRFAGKGIDAQRSARLKEVYSLLGKTGTVYGPVFIWPVFLAAQLFGVCFNVGVLGALFLKVAITDVAFGWQTTLQVTPESVQGFVEMVALPWSWLFSTAPGHPTLSQIAGSQMILKDGMYHLATGDLAAWWPFIILAVAFYGLIPRVLVAGAGLFMKHRTLASIDFTHAACDRLIMRMKTPVLHTQSRPYHPETAKNGLAPDAGGINGNTENDPDAPHAIVLIPSEIRHLLQAAGLENMLAKSLGLQPSVIIPVKMDTNTDSRNLRDALSKKEDITGSPRIVVVQEAWQPPIKETMSWIKALRAAAAGTGGMIIALIGRPGFEADFTRPADTDQRIWEQAVNSLNDPYVRTESLNGHYGITT